MRYILLLLFLTSCASAPKDESKKIIKTPIKGNKFIYLKKFFALRTQLRKQTKICKAHMNMIKINPEAFSPIANDWAIKGEIESLYLTFEFDEEIAKEHFEMTSSVKGCMNELDQLQFVKASSKENIDRYFAYLSTSEMPLLNTVIAAQLIKELHSTGRLTIRDINVYNNKLEQMTQLYKSTGKQTHILFKKKEFKKLYQLNSRLRESKVVFKDFILTSIKKKN